MTSKYQDFSESLVVLGEPKCTSIFPTKGPHAGKETKVLDVNFQRFPTLDAKKLVNAPKMSAHHRGICHF